MSKLIFLGKLSICFFCKSISLDKETLKHNAFKEIQNITYSIQNIETTNNPSAYINALNNAYMINHRLKSESNIIEFEGGVKIIFLSSEKFLANDVNNINPDDFTIQIENYLQPIFRLTDNEYIIELKHAIGNNVLVQN